MSSRPSGEISNETIAKKLGISRARVHQLEKSAIEKLRKGLAELCKSDRFMSEWIDEHTRFGREP